MATKKSKVRESMGTGPIRLRQTDLADLHKVVDGQLHIYDLRPDVRMGLYRLYPGLPLDYDGNHTPEFINALQKFLDKQAQPTTENTCAGGIASAPSSIGALRRRADELEEGLFGFGGKKADTANINAARERAKQRELARASATKFDSSELTQGATSQQPKFKISRPHDARISRHVSPDVPMSRIETRFGPAVVTHVDDDTGTVEVRCIDSGKIITMTKEEYQSYVPTVSASVLESVVKAVSGASTFAAKKAIADRLLESAQKEVTHDIEVDRAVHFAKSHYPGIPAEEAFRKLVVRSLKHAEEDAQITDERIDQLEKDLRDLERDVAGATEPATAVEPVKESLYTRITGKPMAEGVFDMFKKPVKATATAYDQGKRACGSDPSADPAHLARKLPVEDRKEFVKGFNDEAKSRGIKRHGDTGSSDLTHGGLKYAEFKRDMGVSEDKDPCWDGYKQLGMKKKDGKKGLSEWYRKSLGSTDEVISEFQKVIIPEMRSFGVQSNRLNHFTTLSSAIFEGAAKPADSMKELLATFKQLDQRKSIKISVGQKVSILNVVMAGNQIEVFGFKRPKTITRIHREPSDNKIIQLEFDNDSDDVWPRSPMAEFNGEPLVHSVFFQNETEVEKAIMMLELSKPDNVNIRYYVKEELNKNQKRAKQLGPTEKVGPKGAVGKLVGEDRVTKQVSEAIDDILRGTGF